MAAVLLLTAVAVGGGQRHQPDRRCNGLAAVVAWQALLGVWRLSAGLLHDSFMVVSRVIGWRFVWLLCGIFPFGRIFAGDGGRLFCRLLLAGTRRCWWPRHPHVPAWFPMLLLLFYPVFGKPCSPFSAVRSHARSPGHPDACHLQMLYKRAVRWHVIGARPAAFKTLRNALTAPLFVGAVMVGVGHSGAAVLALSGFAGCSAAWVLPLPLFIVWLYMFCCAGARLVG